MSKRISQREAHRLKKRVAELERFIRGRDDRYAYDFPGGTNIAGICLNVDRLCGKLDAASKLGHHLVAKWNGEKLYIYAVDGWRLP